MSYDNRNSPPVGRAYGAHECNVCGFPAQNEAGSSSVKFEYPTFVICITCLNAANEAMKNPRALVVDPIRGPSENTLHFPGV